MICEKSFFMWVFLYGSIDWFGEILINSGDILSLILLEY
jgi:hypothetical protein